MIENNIDITGDMLGASSTPEEAADILTKSKIFDVPPTEYKTLQPEFQEIFDKEILPKEAAKTVASYAAQSDVHASLIKEDVQLLSEAETKYRAYANDVKAADENSRRAVASEPMVPNQSGYKVPHLVPPSLDLPGAVENLWKVETGYFNKVVSTHQLTRERNSIYLEKKANKGILSLEKQMRIVEINGLLPTDTNDSFLEKLPGDVYGVGYDYYAAAKDNPFITVPFAVAGAAAGAVSLYTTKSIPASAYLAAKIAGKGANYANTYDTYKQTAADVYAVLDNAEKSPGVPLNLPESEKSVISSGTGLLVAGIDHLGRLALLNKIPLFKNLMKKSAIVSIVTNPALVKTRTVVTKLGHLVEKVPFLHSATTEGFTEAFQELIQVIGEGTGEAWDGKETSLMSGLNKATTPESIERIFEAGATGAAVGATVNVAGTVLTKPLNMKLEASQKKAQDAAAAREEARKKAKAPPAPTPTPPEGTPTQEPSPTMGVNVDKIEANNYSQSLRDFKKSVDKSKLNKVAPDEAHEIIAKIGKDTGDLYMDPQELNDYLAKNPSNEAMVRKLLGGSAEALERNSSIVVSLRDVLKAMETDHNISDLVKSHPEKRTANDLAKAEAVAKAKQEDVLKAVGAPTPEDKTTITLYHGTKSDFEGVPDVTATKDWRSAPGVYMGNADKASGFGLGGRVVSLEVPKELLKQKQRVIEPSEMAQILSELPGAPPVENNLEIFKGSLPEEQALNRIWTEYVDRGYHWDLGKNIADIKKVFLDSLRKHKFIGVYGGDPEVDTHAQITVMFPELMTETKKTIQPQEINQAPITEEEYLKPPSIPDLINSILPDSEKKRLFDSQLDIKEKVLGEIDRGSINEREDAVDIMTELTLEATREQLAQDTLNDPKINLVEDFTNGVNIDLTGEGKKSGVNRFAINFNTLPPDLQKQYRGNKTLRERGVFAKAGLTGNAAAELLGAKNQAELLDILANSPTRDQSVDAAMEIREQAIRQEVEASVDFDETSKAKTLNDRTSRHIREMKLMLDTHWPDVKRGIKRIALPLPTIAELRNKATNIINNTKIKNLKERVHKFAEIRSQKLAINSILENDVEQAYGQKENAALNNELARATVKSIKSSNRDIRFIATVLGETNQKILEGAGSRYKNAANEILSAFNFTPKSKDRKIQGAFSALVHSMIQDGQGDMSVPDSIINSIDTRGDVNDLTVVQVAALADALRTILKAAKGKDKLNQEYKAAVETHSEWTIANALHEDAIASSNYDTTRGEKPRGLDREKNKIGKSIAQWTAGLAPISYIALQLDNGVHGGLWAGIFYHALKGVGIHEGNYGESAAMKLALEVRAEYKKQIEIYGKKDFNSLGITKIYVKQFEGIPHLSDGNITKLELLMMAKHWGTEENRQRLTNFGVGEETLRGIFDEHLIEKDFDFLQNAVWNIHASFKPKIAALEKLTMGTDTEFVESLPFEFKGKQYAGGYAPLHYEGEINSEEIRHQARKHIDSVSGDMTTEFVPSYAAQGMTKRNYLKDRTGSDKVISLNPLMTALGLEEVIYDLTMRVPISDTLKLLKNSSIAKDIIARVGPENYQILVNTTMEATNSADMDKMRLFAAERKLYDGVLSKVRAASAVNLLAGNLRSILMQQLSMFPALEAMGLKSGVKHLSMTLLKVFNPMNLHLLGDFYNLAVEINPAIKSYTEGLDDHSFSGLKDLQPKERWFKNQPYHTLKNVQESINQLLMGKILGMPDVMQKIAVALATYSQFMAGDAKGHSLDSVMAMTPEMREKAARAYGQHISATTLTTSSNIDKAAIQKHEVGKLFSMYWNDARNQLNNALQVQRNISANFNDAKRKAAEGDILGAIESQQDAATKILTALMLTATASLLRKMIQGDDDSPLKKDGDFVGNVVGHYFASPLHFPEERFGVNMPVVRDILYAAGKRGNVSLPLVKTMTDVKDAFVGIRNALDIVDTQDSMTEKQFKAVVSSVGLFTGGLPVNGTFKALDNLETIGEAVLFPIGVGMGLYDITKKRLEKFIKDHEKDIGPSSSLETSKMELLASLIIGPKAYALSDAEFYRAQKVAFAKLSPQKKLMTNLVNESKDILNQMQPKSKEGPAQRYFTLLKEVEGNNVWNSINEKSHAFGYYQFIKKTWDSIRKQHPELKLHGLYNRNKEQSIADQEKAIRVLSSDIAKTLVNKKLPVTEENVYALHFAGQGAGFRILRASDGTKIKSILSPKALRDNPQLEPTWTAKQFKEWVSSVLVNKRKVIDLRLK